MWHKRSARQYTKDRRKELQRQKCGVCVLGGGNRRRKRVYLNKWRVAWYRITRMVIPPLTIVSLIVNAVLFMN